GVFSGGLVLQDIHDKDIMLALMEPVTSDAARRFPDSGVIFRPEFETSDSFLECITVYTDEMIERLGNVVAGLMVIMVCGKGVWWADIRGGESTVFLAWRSAYTLNSGFYHTSGYRGLLTYLLSLLERVCAEE